jgi:DUF4097 and DUF4098 domain-containing protein YvlB
LEIWRLRVIQKMVKRIVLTVLILTAATVVPHGASVKELFSQSTEQKQIVAGDDDAYAKSRFEPGVEDVREEFHQTYPLSANGRVLLENMNGNVKIAAWDRNEVQVDAVKRASNRERLVDANIEVNASPDSVRIRTRYQRQSQTFDDDERGRYNNPAAVDYTLTVPRQARLESIELVNGSIDITGIEGSVRASSVNGRVVTRGLLGEAKLTTVNGELEATFSKLDESKPLSLTSVNGNVVLIIPSNANAIVRADTVHGSITNDFGLDVTDGDYVGHELYGQIGTGGPRIKLGNVNGGIQIRHSQDGGSLSPAVNLTAAVKDKDKDKVKEKDKDAETDREAELSEAARELREASAEIAAEARAAAREALEDGRIERQARAQARREIDRALIEAQKEIQRAQLQVQREVQQQIREQMRNERRGAGRGVGSGVNRASERESQTFSVSGAPRVNLSTFDGVVTVRSWDKPEVMYTAIKRGNRSEDLKAITIKAEQQGSLVSIIAEVENQESGAVDFELFLPRNISLNASSGDGRLVVEGLSGDITLRTGDGPIEVSNTRGTLMVNTGDGPIRVNGFEGQLDARTGDGSISLDGSFTGLAAQTGSGSVALSVPNGANFILETNAEEVTNQGLTISEDATPSHRVKRWKVGQGGKVFVIRTGEGKVLLRAR